MANDDKGANLSGRDLQESQSGGGSGEFGGNMNQGQAQPVGGGATASDDSSAGGSSGTGGYGKAQNVSLQREGQPEQGSPSSLAEGERRADDRAADGQIDGAPSGQSRGERFDEAQGGGRGVMFDGSGGVSVFAEDQAAHQDRGQSEAAEFERESE